LLLYERELFENEKNNMFHHTIIYSNDEEVFRNVKKIPCSLCFSTNGRDAFDQQIRNIKNSQFSCLKNVLL
jgi:hypothetical protein